MSMQKLPIKYTMAHAKMHALTIFFLLFAALIASSAILLTEFLRSLEAIMKRSCLVGMVAALLLSQSVMASPESCDRYNTSYDKTYCMAKLFVESDKELNNVYKALRNKISGNARNGLTQTQRNWIRYRDDACQPKAGTIDVDCNYRVNRERTQYLRDRLRECNTGACYNEAIVRPSW